MDIVESQLYVNFSCIVGVKLESVGIDISPVFYFMTVWLEVFEVVALVVEAFR